MAYAQELIDTIILNVTVEKEAVPSIFPEIQAYVDKVVRKAEQMPKRAGNKMAEKARLNQMNAINELHAICSGNLIGSITVEGDASTSYASYMVGTKSNDKGYYHLLHGRGAIDGKFMAFPWKCKGEMVYTMYVDGADPKNYMTKSQPKTEADIASIIEEEVANVLS